MRKIANETIEREEFYCDICGKKIKGRDFYICSICERDICYKCFGDPKEIKGTFYSPCPICRTIRGYITKIRKEWKLGDSHNKEAVKLQNQWGRESRQKESTNEK